VLQAKGPEDIQEQPGEKPGADAQFQDPYLLFQRATLVGLPKGAKQELGGGHGQRPVIVDDIGDRGVVAKERRAALPTEVGLANFPFQALGEGARVLQAQPAILAAAESGEGTKPIAKTRAWHADPALHSRAHESWSSRCGRGLSEIKPAARRNSQGSRA
jgi:hypothetical protein